MGEHVADVYDKIYLKDEKRYGVEPLSIVRELAHILSPGCSIFEIGAGHGRNSLFLSSNGFDVTAADISPRAVELLARGAQERQTNMKSMFFNAAHDQIPGVFDAIISTFVFHHLSDAEAHKAIRHMQYATHSGGVNLILSFTKNGMFYQNNPETGDFFLETKEDLAEMYRGWDIIKLFEHAGRARSLGSEGSSELQPNVFAGLLARKP